MFVARFLDDHPGGRDIILEHAGGDASQIFKSDEFHAHSDLAREMLKQYRIGVLEGFNEAKVAEEKQIADFNRAVAPQVLKMGPEYQRWVHHTVGPKGFRLFESNFFESMSHYPWWYIFFMVCSFQELGAHARVLSCQPSLIRSPLQWIPAITLTFYLSLQNGSSLPLSIAMLPVGMLIWTMIEYCLHRFLFHMESNTGWTNWIHFFAHGIHHLSPTDPERLAFPPTFGIIVGTLIYNIVIRIGGVGPAQAMFAGGAFTCVLVLFCCCLPASPFRALTCRLYSYMMYDTMHYFFHHGESWNKYMPKPLGMYFRWMKTRHLDHHFKNENRNYGVTCPIWDWVFGTSA